MNAEKVIQDLFAAHGANVAVTDLSDRQLAAERMVAEREGYDIRCLSIL